jgi:hypothetical protein
MTMIDQRMENLVNVISRGPRDDRLRTKTKPPRTVTVLAWAPARLLRFQPSDNAASVNVLSLNDMGTEV